MLQAKYTSECSRCLLIPGCGEHSFVVCKDTMQYLFFIPGSSRFIMSKITSRTIVFLTGAFVSHACWGEWQLYFESKGYRTLAPPWLKKDADAATLRNRHPDRELAAVTLPDLLSYYRDIIRGLPEQPILIGHSFGGLAAQILLNEGLAAACIAVHSAPPKGVIPYELNFLRSNAKALGFFTAADKTYMISFKSWQFAFANGMNYEAQKESYYKLACPESKRAIRGGLTDAAYVDFGKKHAPLLFLAGTLDQCIPAHLCRRVFTKYTDTDSVTEFVLKERNHMILGLPTWKEDAAYILNWIEQQ